MQRDSRVRLQQALAERHRMRASLYSLKHAREGVHLTPLVIDRRANTLGRRGGGAKLQGGNGNAAAQEESASPSPPLRLVGRHLGNTSVWHDATSQVSVSDGGALQLWQALREKAEQPVTPPPALTAEERVLILENLFVGLRQLLERSPPLRMGVPLVEELYRYCSREMIDHEGAREVLLPLLRLAAEHTAVSGEEARRLQMQYAFPNTRRASSTTSTPAYLRRFSVIDDTGETSFVGAGRRRSHLAAAGSVVIASVKK